MELIKIEVDQKCEYEPGDTGTFYFVTQVDELVATLRAELAANEAWHASYCRVQDENTDLKEMLATEIAASTALRTELAAANAKVAELTEEVATLTRINSELNYAADILAAMVKEE